MEGQKQRYLYSSHTWILFVIILLITILYYSWPYLGFRPEWLWSIMRFEFNMRFSGSLFYIPLIYTAVISRWRGILIMWIIVIALTIPLTLYFRHDATSIIVNILFLSVPMLIVGYITLERRWRNRERQTLMEREKERQNYVAQVFQAQEDERKRIARELHDDAIHSLLITANRVSSLASAGDHPTKESLRVQAEEIRADILRVSDELRRLTLDLRPGILDNIGFIPALRWLVNRLNQEQSMDARLTVIGDERKIPHEREVILFRIVQEALNNVLKHAKAGEVIVTLAFGDETVKIFVYDNGAGFAVPERINSFAAAGKLGLTGIQERVRSLDGALDIKSQPGTGTLLSVEFKL